MGTKGVGIVKTAPTAVKAAKKADSRNPLSTAAFKDAEAFLGVAVFLGVEIFSIDKNLSFEKDDL
jgi:hypothetical protein